LHQHLQALLNKDLFLEHILYILLFYFAYHASHYGFSEQLFFDQICCYFLADHVCNPGGDQIGENLFFTEHVNEEGSDLVVHLLHTMVCQLVNQFLFPLLLFLQIAIMLLIKIEGIIVRRYNVNLVAQTLLFSPDWTLKSLLQDFLLVRNIVVRGVSVVVDPFE